MKYILPVLILLPSCLYACPLCSSEEASRIRAHLLGSTLLENLVATISPFFILYFFVYIYSQRKKKNE